MSAPQSVPFVVAKQATGRITGYGRAALDDVPLQAGAGEVVVAGLGDDLHDWVNPGTGLIEARPAIGLAPAVSLAVGAEWEIGLVPTGTRVIIDGTLMAETEGDALTLQFSVAATYQLDLVAPFPWRSAASIVAVA